MTGLTFRDEEKDENLCKSAPLEHGYYQYPAASSF